MLSEGNSRHVLGPVAVESNELQDDHVWTRLEMDCLHDVCCSSARYTNVALVMSEANWLDLIDCNAININKRNRSLYAELNSRACAYAIGSESWRVRGNHATLSQTTHVAFSPQESAICRSPNSNFDKKTHMSP